MKKQDQIFYLVKSLSKSEKRNFRTNTTGAKNYIKLFDVIDSQQKFDGNEIKELFKNSKFIKQLHVTKNYLIKQILKSLRNDNPAKSINIKLNNLLSEIEILYSRELFDQCLFLTEKAANIAKEYEKHNYSSIILNWKQKIFLQTKNVVSDKYLFDELFSDKAKSNSSSNIENEYWNLTISQFDNFSKPPKEKAKFFKTPLLRNFENAKTLRSKINYHHIHYSNFVTNNKPAEALSHLQKLEKEIEFNPHRISEDPSAYITTLNNQVSLLLNTRNYEQISHLLNKIRAIPEKFNIGDKDKISTKLNVRTYNVELEMYRDIKDYEKALDLIPIVENYISENQKAINRDYTVLFYYQFAYIYFMVGNYNKSLNWTNKLFGNDLAKIRGDLYTYSRFLNLMIHFELSNQIVLKYAVDATRKHLRKNRTLLNFEKVLLKFFSKISMANKNEYNNLFTELKTNLFANTEENRKNDILDYIDFESWIDKKLDNL